MLDEKFELLICIDNNYLMPTEIWLYNLYRNTPPEVLANLRVRLGYFGGQLSFENIEKLKTLSQLIGIELLPQEENLEGVLFPDSFSASHLPVTAFIRIKFIFSLQNSFIYMDVDTLLSPGWHEIFTEMNRLVELGKPIAAVKDMWIQFGARPDTTMEFLKPDSAFEYLTYGYFNSGIMVVNPKALAGHSFQEALDILPSIKENHSIVWDQDVLNALFFAEVHFLENTYNFMACDPFLWNLAANILRNQTPKIIHYVNLSKPWSSNMMPGMLDEYRDTVLGLNCERPFLLAHRKYLYAIYEYETFRRINGM